MNKYFAFLRAVNVGGHIVKMEHLRQLFESLGFTKVETFIASGNVIFESPSQNIDSLEKKMEVELNRALGYEVVPFIRSEKELEIIATYQAFSQSKLNSATAFNIAFLKEPLDKIQLSRLMELKTDIDEFSVKDREIYWLCQKKQSESTFSNAVLEKKLQVKSTLRGANTINKMVVKYIRNLE